MGVFRSSRGSDGEPSASVEDRLAQIGPGVPGHCPSCDGLGYIDNLDIGHRYQIQHCKDCGQRWEYLFDTEGRVVGLTELDDAGQPVARMRIRTRPLVAERAAPAAPPVEAPVEAAPQVVDLRTDEVIDLRDPEPAPEPPAPTEPAHMSPAEWLRHAVRR